MTIQVLVVTMNQKQGDYSLLDKMNIQSDAIVCNQCDRNEVEEFIYNGHHIKWMSFAEKGVGLNRNNGLMRSTADMLILADDDMVFHDDYASCITAWAKQVPNADVMLFSLEKPIGQSAVRVRKHNFGRYGAARMVLRSKKIKLFGIAFSTEFGGGTKYSCGEDSLFLSECLTKGLIAMDIPASIAVLTDERESSWFRGYTDKYFFDKGVLYYAINKRVCKLLSLYHCVKHWKLYAEYGWLNGWKKMCEGIDSVV